jgi:hypothetical protein
MGNFKVKFDLVNDKIELVDISGAETFKGIFKITGPGNIPVYENVNFETPDLSEGANLFNTISIPKDIKGKTVFGKYTFKYQHEGSAAGTRIVDFCEIFPSEVKIETEVDCLSGILTSLDRTSYGNKVLTLERAHIVYYPSALEKEPVTSSSSKITVTPIFTKTWTTKIESFLVYGIGEEDTIEVIIKGIKETNVSCDFSLCELSCCLIVLNKKYLQAKFTNSTQAKYHYEQLSRVVQLSIIFGNMMKCGQGVKAKEILDEIKDIVNCEKGCGCSDKDTPQQIVPITSGGGGTEVNVTAGNGIVVTTQTIGGTITYNVSLTGDVLQKVNSLYNTEVVAEAGIKVTPTTNGLTTTYAVGAVAGEELQEKNKKNFTVINPTPIDTITVATAGTYIILLSGTVSVSAKENNWEKIGGISYSVNILKSGSAIQSRPVIEENLSELTVTHTVAAHAVVQLSAGDIVAYNLTQSTQGRVLSGLTTKLIEGQFSIVKIK